MLSQISGSIMEVKDKTCFSLHNETTGRNFVISADSQTELEEWIEIIQPHLLSPQVKFHTVLSITGITEY